VIVLDRRVLSKPDRLVFISVQIEFGEIVTVPKLFIKKALQKGKLEDEIGFFTRVLEDTGCVGLRCFFPDA